MRLNQAVGVTIRKLRTEQNKSMRQLTPYISLGHLSNAERGTRELSQELLEEVSKGLNLTTADFLMEVVKILKES
jgi:transcriptional regulator with XRE-family HTH domain